MFVDPISVRTPTREVTKWFSHLTTCNTSALSDTTLKGIALISFFLVYVFLKFGKVPRKFTNEYWLIQSFLESSTCNEHNYFCTSGQKASCRTATLDFFFDLAESKVAVFLCSILTSDGVPFCFGKNSFPWQSNPLDFFMCFTYTTKVIKMLPLTSFLWHDQCDL